MAKQYGLIIPGNKSVKAPPIFQAKRNVFGDESDSEGEMLSVKPSILPGDKLKKKAQIVQDKALAEDPTVYQYDEIYENMEQKKKEEKTVSKVEKKPKYIEKLLQSANKRKIENERCMERQVQKEREKEGDEFADKESFVTNAYKQKLEELRAEEEREKREEYLESIGDVTKQRDLGGFYRHLYEQKLGPKEEKKPDLEERDQNTDENSHVPHVSPEAKTAEESEENKTLFSKKKNRNYRKRSEFNETEVQLSEGEVVSSEEEGKVPTLKNIRDSKNSSANVDADSDFSSDSSDSNSENDKMKRKAYDNDNIKCKKQKIGENLENTETADDEKFKMPVTKEKNVARNDTKKEEELEDVRNTTSPQPKIDIWKKRTVGTVFEEALKRYYERKAARSH